MIKGHIERRDPSTSERVFKSLDEWRRTEPVVFINNSWATLDQNCALLAPDNTSQECIETMQTTTLSFLNSASFYALVGISACFVLLFIIVVTIFFHRQRARIKHNETSVVLQ